MFEIVLKSQDKSNFVEIAGISFPIVSAESQCLEKISKEAMIDIYCVYETGKAGVKFSEEYENLHAYESQLLELYQNNVDEYINFLDEFAGKSIFIKYVLRGLQLLNQKSILSELNKSFNLEEMANKYESASAGSIISSSDLR